MPNAFLDADVGFPRLEAYASTEDKFAAIQNYLFLLLENLRYTLRNLSMEENFNASELSAWVDGLDIKANTVVSNTVITNELYAGYGAVADLAVDEVRTDYMRAARYLAGNTANLDYLYIHDEELSFLTGTVKRGANNVPLTEQLHHGSRFFWWKDETHTQMTSLEDTGLPVIVFQYEEAVKASFYFSTETETVNGVTATYRVPVLKLGEGTDAGGVNGTAKLVKGVAGLDALYRTRTGELRGMAAKDDYTDLYGLRKPTVIDFSELENQPEGQITVTLDGSVTEIFTYSETQTGCVITDGTGHETEVIL